MIRLVFRNPGLTWNRYDSRIVLDFYTNKGVAVKQICQESDIKPEDCLAIGDSLSDIAMFKEVGVGVAFSKLEEVKKQLIM